MKSPRISMIGLKDWQRESSYRVVATGWILSGWFG